MEKTIKFLFFDMRINKPQVVEIELKYKDNITIKSIFEQIGISNYEMKEIRFGIFGQYKNLDNTVYNGDRLEIYHPLLIDPIEARKKKSKNFRK